MEETIFTIITILLMVATGYILGGVTLALFLGGITLVGVVIALLLVEWVHR